VTLIFVLERRCECSISNGLPVLGETEKMKEITFSRSAANSMTGSNWLRVPVDLVDKLDKLAEKKGIIARGKWAVYARTVLTEHINKEGSE